MSQSRIEGQPALIQLVWLVKLRWTMIVGQLALFVGVHWGLGLRLPLLPLGVMVGLGALTNLWLGWQPRKERSIPEWLLGLVMMFDVLLLTGMLYVTGGPANPFSFLYLVFISLGIVVLGTRWVWGLSWLALLCYGSLFIQWGGGSHHMIHSPHHMRMHLEGMWVAYAITTVCIVYFVTRMKRELTLREAEVAALNDLQIRSEKIAALAALAGGAVHEFSTPLSTIAVIAGELERGLEPENQALLSDVRLIREEVLRCKKISQGLMLQAGESLGEMSLQTSIDALFESTLSELSRPDWLEVGIDEEIKSLDLPVPPMAFSQMLRGMIHNAKEASVSGTPVSLLARLEKKHLVIEVIDRGYGIDPALLPRLGEPFLTTKPASQGHGLGLFLAKTLMERLGGELRIHSVPNEGTTVRMLFALSMLSQKATTT